MGPVTTYTHTDPSVAFGSYSNAEIEAHIDEIKNAAFAHYHQLIHPGGRPKQVSLEELNELEDLLDHLFTAMHSVLKGKLNLSELAEAAGDDEAEELRLRGAVTYYGAQYAALKEAYGNASQALLFNLARYFKDEENFEQGENADGSTYQMVKYSGRDHSILETLESLSQVPQPNNRRLTHQVYPRRQSSDHEFDYCTYLTPTQAQQNAEYNQTTSERRQKIQGVYDARGKGEQAIMPGEDDSFNRHPYDLTIVVDGVCKD